jgi:hypothetical protein
VSVPGGDIHLSIHEDGIVVDHDSDSSFNPSSWITVYGLGNSQDFHFNMTFDEAKVFRNRLDTLVGGPDA